MTVVIRGKTKCALCGGVLELGEKIVGFAHFLGPEHPLWRYSDAAMHRLCYERWPERETFEQLYEDWRIRAKAAARAAATPERQEARRLAADQERAEREARDRAHNDEHARTMAEIARTGAACPHCGGVSDHFRELRETARARLVCPKCARSCFAVELLPAES
jgi:hypothetical protein